MKSLVALIAASALLVWASVVLRREKSVGALLLFVGAGGFLIVALAHVAEWLQLFRGMGWGERHSAGHYLDLAGAVLGVVLTPLGLVLRLTRRSGART